MNRVINYINAGWLFKYGLCEGVENTLDFEDFSNIGLPHTFTLPYKGGNDFYTGYGVYVKELFIDKKFVDKRILLEFGAVFQVAEIYLNGYLVKKHEGGYTAFTADISTANEGKNIIVVRVNNVWSPIIAPRAGEHTFCGGIYRDVKLIITDKKYIDWYGIFVNTSIVNKNFAEINIEIDTINSLDSNLAVEILDKNGNFVKKIDKKIDNNKTIISLAIDNPILWDIDNPYLYKLICKTDYDNDEVEFGIRYFEWTKEKGFYLNGKHILLQGANVHQDHGGWGDAVTHSGIKRDISLMKECGMNFIRGSHYPHHTEFAKECDRQGLLFWSEGLFWGIGGFSDEGYWDSSAMPTLPEYFEPFEKSLKTSMYEMIKTNRNSPSIIAWSVGNEIFFSKKDVMEDAKSLVSRMVEFSHENDPTRPCGVGGVQRENFDKLGDIVGYNGDGAYLFMNPKLPSIVAEYGSIPEYRPGSYSLNLTKGSDKIYDWRAGRAIWCGFHHGSIANIGNLGIVDLYRLPLKSWYCYREKFRNIPPPIFAKEGIPYALQVMVDKESITCDGLDDCMLTVFAINEKGEKVSCDLEVTLTANGGGLFPTGQSMTFSKKDHSFYDGACAIEMRSYYAGKITVTASCKGLRPSSIYVIAVGEKLYNGEEIVLPQEPFYEKRKPRKGSDIIANRPIVVSSEKYLGMSGNLNDGNKNTLWTPLSSDKTPSILLDLENMYERFMLNVSTKSFSRNTITVKASADRISWEKIGEMSFNWLKRQASINIVGQGFRYLKLEWDGENDIKINSINAFQQ